MANYISNSEGETKKIAAKIAKENLLAGRNIFALTGELGAGKTIFAQGVAKGLDIKEKIISPTFVLIRQHKIPQSEKVLYHIDLYRVEDTNLGLEEILSDPNNIILIEWAQKAEKILPKNTVKINITKESGHSRLISTSIDPSDTLETNSISL